MGIIGSEHDLSAKPGGTNSPAQAPGGTPERSRYCYLFPDPANHPEAGLFPDTSPEVTFAQLKRFEENFRPPELPERLQIELPAVYTYFGQFVNHDMSAPVGGLLVNVDLVPLGGVIGTLDLPGLSKQERGRADSIGPILDHIQNQHARPLTLTSLYADGPSSHDQDVRRLYTQDGKRFLLAQTATLSEDQIGAITKTPFDAIRRNTGAYDLPRKGEMALIADRRNDSNLIISQLHLALMLVHNKAIDVLQPQIADAAKCFDAARQLVTLHYQWCILNDYLPHLLSDGVLEKVRAQPARLKAANEVPMEFTTAAFRFGHSMVGATYDFNDNFGNRNGPGKPIREHATLKDLFDFTSRGKMNGQATQLPDHWVADWDRLTRPKDDGGSPAESIDMDFAPDMLNLVGESTNLVHGSIFFRNILRGFHRRIPFGQNLAREYGIPVLTASEVRSAIPAMTTYPYDADLRTMAEDLGLLTHTPAWLYFLCEAKVKAGGERLGPTASHIIADTFVGLLGHKDNPSSVINAEGGRWHPRNSPLKDAGGRPLESIRTLLLFAVEGTKNSASREFR